MSRRFKTLFIWGVLLGIVFFGLYYKSSRDAAPTARVSAKQAIEMVDEGMVSSFRYGDQQQLLLLTNDGESWAVDHHAGTDLRQYLNAAGVHFVPKPPARSGDADFYTWMSVLVPIVVIIFVFYFLRKTRGGQLGNVLELRKSKARPVSDDNKARFADIGGNREAVELLEDIVDFLRTPERWTKVGTRLPRGILVVGPPGTGKTLLARAVAGETKSTFFYASAAEFVEMFVGVGAARIRDTFDKAIAQRPAVIFIDEIDAIGRRRGSGSGAMHEEREQTLNQLLVLMDGLERHDRLVVIAATNRPDVLDPALLRSGRFDRTLRLKSPTFEGRVEILRIHTRKKPLDESVSLEQIARQTDGLTGADLETLTNDAALLAVRRNRDNPNLDQTAVSLSMEDFHRALEAMSKSNRQFDRLDSVLVESVSQFAEPTGRAVARITLTTGTVVEGEVIWMNAGHIKLRLADGSEVIVAKQMAEQISPLDGTEMTAPGDFAPDRWAAVKLDAR